MNVRLALLLVPSVITIVLGIIVLMRNWHTSINRAYAIFNVLVVLWLFSSYFTDVAGQDSTMLLFAKLAFYIGYLSVVGFYVFTWYFPRPSVPDLKTRLSVYVVTLALALISIGNGVVGSIEPKDGVTNIIAGPYYGVFLAGILYILVLIVQRLTRLYRNTKSSERSRVLYVLIGGAIAGAWGILTNVVLVGVKPEWEAQNYAPLGILLLAVAIAISIVRHKLFDIRLVVARALGYILSIGVLSLIYGFLAFNIINQFIFAGENINFHQRIVYTVLAVIIAFTFQPLKRFFDKWTNRIFYRDAYDSQVLLDKLNKTLVSTIELDKLLTGVSTVIADTVKTEFCVFGVKDMPGSKQRVIGTAQRTFDKLEIEEVRAITPTLKVKTIVTDELGDEHSKLRTLLRKNDIAVLVRLTDTPGKKAEGIGYIVLGAKKSGSPYTKQDITVLEIIGDELVIAIQNSLRFEEIKNFNITLQKKVDDATRQLRQTNEKLKQLDQTKDDFISMASHQLRTPLTSIKGYVSMVMEGDAGKITKQQTKLLDQAFISSQRMVYLIADLLNVSRLRTGKFIIESKPTNLAEVVEGELSQLTETAKGRDLELTYDKPKDFPELMLDETKTRQVIMNFVDNAIYYTPTGGHIKVEVHDAGDSIEFLVSDDGIGVPKREQHHLFTKFYRAGNAKKARPDGTGLGLFMAKKVIVAQGGSIIFKTQEGKGSTFGFAFTKKPLLPENFKGVESSEKPDL